jgi:hypothetical protein
MAIGRSEDRDNPWNPLVLGHHGHVWDPIREPHLGQRPSVPHTQAGHMTAIDRNRFRRPTLARRGPSTYGFRAASLRSAPGMTTYMQSSTMSEPRSDRGEREG